MAREYPSLGRLLRFWPRSLERTPCFGKETDVRTIPGSLMRKLTKSTELTVLNQRTEEFLDRVLGKSRLDRIKNAQEAQSCSAYIDDIAFILSGAATEYFKCLIHDRLKAHHKDRQHWEDEWRFHLGPMLKAQVERAVKFNGNRGKAIQKAIQDFTTTRSKTSITTATNTIAKYLQKDTKEISKLISSADVKALLVEFSLAAKAIEQEQEIKKEPNQPWNNKPRKLKKN
jgi:hypothetical protein